MKKVTIGDLSEFDNDRFNKHYRKLIDIGMTSQREEDAMNTLSFINDFQILIENLKSDMAGEPDECQECREKDLIIEELRKSIDLLNEIKTVQKTKITELERMLEQTSIQSEPTKTKVSK